MLNELSNHLADAVAAAAPSVVQVVGRRRPITGIVHAADTVVTTTRAIGRDDRLHVRRHDGVVCGAELAGWDPATQLAVLRVPGLALPPVTAAAAAARVGHIGLALARSWSNAITASAGLVSVIGGPLATGRRLAIDEVIRTNAPLHDGFSGGAFLDTSGHFLGLTTALAIRGLHVVIPATIVASAATRVLQQGSARRGFLGLAGQGVQLPPHQAGDGNARGVLVLAVAAGSPAAAAGVLVGDVVQACNGQPLDEPEGLLDVLATQPVGAQVSLALLRGGASVVVEVTVGERPAA